MGAPSPYGVGNYSAGLYSRNWTDVASEIVLSFGTFAKAQRIKELGSDVTLSVSSYAKPIKLAGADTDIEIAMATALAAIRVQSADMGIVVDSSVYSYGEIVKNITTEISPYFEFSAGFVRVDARSDVVLVFSTEANAYRVAGGRSPVVVGMQVAPAIGVIRQPKSKVDVTTAVMPYATYLVGAESEFALDMAVSANVEQGSFWNNEQAPAPDWVVVPDDGSIWTPVNREHPFDA